MELRSIFFSQTNIQRKKVQNYKGKRVQPLEIHREDPKGDFSTIGGPLFLNLKSGTSRMSTKNRLFIYIRGGQRNKKLLVRAREPRGSA